MIRVALNGSTLGPCPLDEELAAAAAAGFALVELRAPKLAGVADLGERLRRHGLAAWSINSLERVGEAGLLDEARRLAAAAAAVACPYVVAVPGRTRAGLEDAVGELGAACRAEGAELAFEFLGFSWSAARTLGEAVAVADAAGGLPVVIDAFHWASGGSDLEDLRRLDPARLAVVHVNDAPTREVERLGDADRVLPGAGVLPLTGLYQALNEIGYDGVLSVELFNPELWARGPAEAAALSYAAVSALARRFGEGAVA